ncbi:DNA/RNA non-specific endonuclease [Thalassococcus lentus]|uniref:Serine protease n=1 Tax=Thalassococcus lentus TaxID=1210524 RepID=A0ABT4XML9_9RHOB|nr:DNA/RNA non-specific endonuclease [Thalassococcus lentus]MDA7423191.1 DNA/RNA non-specific endonuclease [Thalassococcus lentus]
MTPEVFLAELQAAEDDLEKLEALGAHIIDGGAPSMPFQPDLRLQGMALDDAEEGMTFAMNLANAWARSYRLAVFRRKIRDGYSGPVVVSEGDSWFQYPWLLDDVIDNLMDSYAVLSLGAAGDTLENMRAGAEYRQAISDQGAEFFLFSASGNDVLGGGDLSKLLNVYQPGMEMADLIKPGAVDQTLSRIEQGYDAIISDALSLSPGLQVFFHGYDRPVPRSDGKWLGKPMTDLGIPKNLQREIVGHLIDRLNQRLDVIATRFPGRAHHVDCRGQVGTSINSWYDELHPRNAGYARVADLFLAQMHSAEGVSPGIVVPPMDFELSGAKDVEPVTPLDLALEAMEQDMHALVEEAIIGPEDTPGQGAHCPCCQGDHSFGEDRGHHLTESDVRLVDEYLSVLSARHEPDLERRRRARRHMVPDDDSRAFERILGESNLFPVNYLSRGASKARAVAKVQLFMRGEIPVGSGSGFLVAPGLMLTNNHVLPSRDAARRAKAIFDYQDDDQYQPMPTQSFQITDDVFFTSDRNALDFTFVSVRMDNEHGASLDDYGQFALIEESGKAVKGEPVSIIQHPRGDRKSIALRDSTIVGVKDAFIYYSTDTEPGSSGAPVLNDQWLPVALHHRSVPHPTIEGRWIANRGIRISQIFARLRAAAAAGDSQAAKILRLLEADPQDTTAPVQPDPAPLRPGETRFIPALDATDVLAGGAAGGAQGPAFESNRWNGIDGYNPDFLSSRVPLPLPQGLANVRQVDGRPDLPYMHFSVVMHETRKLAMLTACNTDGASLRRLDRSDSWRTEPRIPLTAQVDNAAYKHNDYDRGHLVRRLAPMWGTEAEAAFAMSDTYHYTVCAPQHARLNQGIWLELEDYLLEWAEDNDARLSIFTGPVFRADDPLYRGLVQVPADYWKVAVADGPSGLRSVAYLHTQKNLIPTVDEAFGDYRTHRVPVHVIAELTGLDFAALQPFDAAGGGFEMAGAVRVVLGREDIGF